MKPRLYNKLYVNKNREDASDDIAFGYHYESKQNVFKKDVETYFYIPLYSNPIHLNQSGLIEAGAHPNIIPALSDRIFKNLKDYGLSTPEGKLKNSFEATGTWFCSWLKKDKRTNRVQWFDRIYNPGQFVYSSAIEDLTKFPDYTSHDPIFRDVPSTMILEPGVQYRYFHVGEQEANNLLTTFEGVSAKHLKLHLVNWGNESVDRVNTKTKINITTNAPQTALYTQKINTDTSIFNSSVNFDNEYTTTVAVDYSSAYNLTNELTWSFWAFSNNWQENTTTQLVGNFSTEGEGIGVFIETPDYCPFLVIPETKYGHLLFLNQDGEGYLDKSVNISTLTPACFAINSQKEVIVCCKGRMGLIYKTDHTGDILTSTKNIDERTNYFTFPFNDETPLQVMCGLNDDVYVVTNRAYYVFDKNLYLIKTIPQGQTAVGAFSYNLQEGTSKFELTTNVNDVKFIETTKWSLSSTNGDLCKNDVVVKTFDSPALTLSVDPNNQLWITHANNEITKVDTVSLSSQTMVFGPLYENNEEAAKSKKTVSFFKKYTKKTNSFTWYAVVFQSYKGILYFCDLQGNIQFRTLMSDVLDYKLLQTKNHDFETVEFNATGDFTGYEYERVFKHQPLISNSPQLCLKLSCKDLSKKTRLFNTREIKIPITKWNLNTWQHIAFTIEQKQVKLFVNGNVVGSLTLKGNDLISYDTQPSLYIGSPLGHKYGLNKEIRYPTSIFNGKIGDIRIYDYALNNNEIELFSFASKVSQDLIWSMPTGKTQYVEKIEHFFKNKLPGAKSQFFNVILHGTTITDPTTRNLIELELQKLIQQIKPAYTDLLKIKWSS